MIHPKRTITPIPKEIWTSRAKNHLELLAPFADAFIKRRGVGISHPVHDFLFTYYNCSPLKLKQWIPSIEEELVFNEQLQEEYSWLNDYWFALHDNVVKLNRARLPSSIIGLAKFVGALCHNILHQPSRFGCFGLHEWAMVYKLPQDSIRHHQRRLRLSPEKLEEFVESQTICCTHYDAYRFFTKEAHPLNTLNPILEKRLEMEQGGCLHANMDLYKWGIKLWPWIGSDFLARAFFIALKAREVDMRASPYDLEDLGYAPICVETDEGRKQYQKEQQLLAEQAIPVRKELNAFCNRLLMLLEK